MAIPFLLGAVAAAYGGKKTLDVLDKMKEADHIMPIMRQSIEKYAYCN